MFPKFLIQERKALDLEDEKEYVHYYPVATSEEVDEFLADAERPGFGTNYRRIEFQVFAIEAKLVRSQEQVPFVLFDKALELEPYGSGGCTQLGSGVKVKVGLRGLDGPAVFWDGRDNSFAIVKPPAGAPRSIVSDQKVMLLSINGIGEIRWDVTRSCASWPENREAVAHFGLTY